MQAEVFHIHHQGEQRGPYTAKQVNHLYRSGFIDDDTLYWREGLEQWQPVTEIVERRKKRNRLVFWTTLAGVALVITLLWSLFGTVTLERWQEMTSGEFTAESAWWRARGLVREQIAEGHTVQFDEFTEAEVALSGTDGAIVVLGGTLTGPAGEPTHAAWRVRLRYERNQAAWLPAGAKPNP
jgi:GYF domain 2